MKDVLDFILDNRVNLFTAFLTICVVLYAYYDSLELKSTVSEKDNEDIKNNEKQ